MECQATYEETLTDIFRTLFHQPALELTDDLTAKQVPGWDSLNHVNLIIQIEEELGIKFRNDEVAKLVNVGELKAMVREKVAQKTG
ncbi:MAG: acyl carrier protein [Planctomycetes bacterium]|nr:acyl carrier protein [Planctomycetota bacterium]